MNIAPPHALLKPEKLVNSPTYVTRKQEEISNTKSGNNNLHRDVF
jgi:hypothetical protein